MTAAVPAQVGSPSIVEQVATAQRRARLFFRVQFGTTWLVLLGVLIFLLWVTGNVDLDFIARAGPFIVQGAWLTVLISLSSIALAVVLALFGALGRISKNAVINAIASLYVSLVRGTPLLVQIFFVYLALPQLGITLPVVLGGILALGFNYGAYMTEIFRAGIQAVAPSQREASQALGMPESLTFRRVVLPQAFRIVIPAIGNDFVAMIKDSSLVYVLGVQELLWRASTLGRRELASLEGLLIAAAVYWGLTIVFSFFQERLERRMARGDR